MLPVEQFGKLSEEKQAAVLSAAFRCFGKTGYKKTSVADIARAAGISKASVFQYFGTKKALYLHLFDYACDKILAETPAGNDDFFDCLRIGSEAKLRVAARHPGMFDFLSTLVTEEDEDIVGAVNERSAALVRHGVSELLSNVNWDKFRPEIDREMAVNVVRWVNEGYLKTAVGVKDTGEIVRELTRYLSLLKRALYKEMYLK